MEVDAFRHQGNPVRHKLKEGAHLSIRLGELVEVDAFEHQENPVRH